MIPSRSPEAYGSGQGNWGYSAGTPPESPARTWRLAVGHPFGASGTRYVLTLATELRVRKARYGVLGVCVGSGQGVALVIEGIAEGATMP
jgi:hypothetical protein